MRWGNPADCVAAPLSILIEESNERIMDNACFGVVCDVIENFFLIHLMIYRLFHVCARNRDLKRRRLIELIGFDSMFTPGESLKRRVPAC